MPSSIDYTGRDVLDNDPADTFGEKLATCVKRQEEAWQAMVIQEGLTKSLRVVSTLCTLSY